MEATGGVAKGWEGEGTEGKVQGAGGLGVAVVGTVVMATVAGRVAAAKDVGRAVAVARLGPGTDVRAVGWRWGCSGRWLGWHRKYSASLQQVGRRNSMDGKW